MSMTDTYWRIAPSDSEALYHHNTFIRLRFADESTAQRWAKYLGLSVKQVDSSFWIDVTPTAFPEFHQPDLASVLLAWVSEFCKPEETT
jgi:hypothetical protein